MFPAVEIRILPDKSQFRVPDGTETKDIDKATAALSGTHRNAEGKDKSQGRKEMGGLTPLPSLAIQYITVKNPWSKAFWDSPSRHKGRTLNDEENYESTSGIYRSESNGDASDLRYQLVVRSGHRRGKHRDIGLAPGRQTGHRTHILLSPGLS